MRFLKNKTAQSTAEYAILIAIVIGAAVAMQIYIKRGFQTNLKFATDKMTAKEDGTATEQYEPYYQVSDFTSTKSNVSSKVTTQEGGGVTRDTSTAAPETTERAGYQKNLKYTP